MEQQQQGLDIIGVINAIANIRENKKRTAIAEQQVDLSKEDLDFRKQGYDDQMKAFNASQYMILRDAMFETKKAKLAELVSVYSAEPDPKKKEAIKQAANIVNVNMSQGSIDIANGILKNAGVNHSIVFSDFSYAQDGIGKDYSPDKLYGLATSTDEIEKLFSPLGITQALKPPELPTDVSLTVKTSKPVANTPTVNKPKTINPTVMEMLVSSANKTKLSNGIPVVVNKTPSEQLFDAMDKDRASRGEKKTWFNTPLYEQLYTWWSNK